MKVCAIQPHDSFESRQYAHIMIHEQHFPPDLSSHSYEFEGKLEDAVAMLTASGFVLYFFEEMMQ